MPQTIELPDTLAERLKKIANGNAFAVAPIEAALEDVHPSLPPPNFAGTSWDGLAMIRELHQEWEEKERRVFAEAFPAHTEKM